MVFVFCDDASKDTIKLKGDDFKYLIKVRRHKTGDVIHFRNRQNTKILYMYEIISINGRDALLKLKEQKELIIKPNKYLHVGWCLIDPKIVEKTIPVLCELGVEHISFIRCDRTQHNFKLDFNRLQRIQESSMQQSGRSTYITFDTYQNIDTFLTKFPNTKIFDFGGKDICDFSNISHILIGCEGGFTQREREIFNNFDTFLLPTPLILRSQSAVMAIASKILL